MKDWAGDSIKAQLTDWDQGKCVAIETRWADEDDGIIVQLNPKQAISLARKLVKLAAEAEINRHFTES